MEHKKLVKEIEDYLKEITKKQRDNNIFQEHIIPVRNFALELAEIYNADKKVVEIAALLHDVYYMETGDHSEHEIKGLKSAERILNHKIDEKRLKLILKCIKHHRGSKDYKRESIEEQITACSDAMSHISNCLNFMHPTFTKGRRTLKESKKFLKDKIERGWKKITLPKARKMIEKKYKAIMILLEDGSKKNQ